MTPVATSGTAVVSLPADDQILITREFDAPKHLVYKAWTTPELVSRWWPGRRGQMKVAEIDLQVGGRWRYAMDAQGGFEVAFHGEYREIVENERLVYTEVFEGAADAGFTVNEVTFTEVDGRTHLESLTICPSKEVRDLIIDSGMEVGVQEGMDLLEQIAIDLRGLDG
jgi:uncharacterized protein YndB with AHSA1/START domain